MKTVGIIAEYNPFHNGHNYHIQKAKALTNADFVIVVMSGNFVQRGVPALISKYERTKMALLNGAHMVFELPVRYATGSAEYFAMGAIGLLHNLGFVDSVCFGSECGNISQLSSLADLFLQEPMSIQESIQNYLKHGMTYPAARAKAVCRYMEQKKTPYDTQLLVSPNNILAIEYLKALKCFHSHMTAYTVPRYLSEYHDSSLPIHSISSASAIRKAILENNAIKEIHNHVPNNVYTLLRQKHHQTFPIVTNDFSAMLYYRLLSAPPESFSSYADVSSDFSKRLVRLQSNYKTYDSFCEMLKTKQYTRTRIDRGLLHILLSIPSYSVQNQSLEKLLPYARLLGLNKEASKLLREQKIPIITKTADAKKQISSHGLHMLKEDIFSSDLYNYTIHSKYGFSVKSDYQRSPIIF